METGKDLCGVFLDNSLWSVEKRGGGKGPALWVLGIEDRHLMMLIKDLLKQRALVFWSSTIKRAFRRGQSKT